MTWLPPTMMLGTTTTAMAGGKAMTCRALSAQPLADVEAAAVVNVRGTAIRASIALGILSASGGRIVGQCPAVRDQGRQVGTTV